MVSRTTTLTLAAVFFAAASAHAEICVIVDGANDTLTESERIGALALARTSFESAGEVVTEPPCDSQYKLSNIRMGSAIIVKVGGPKGNRTGKAASIEDLGAIYDQMIRSLVKGEAFDNTAGNAITRKNVTADQAVPLRASADSLGYFAIGGGYIQGVDANEVPISLGGGYRYELDSFAIDLSMNLVLQSGADDEGGAISWFGQVGGLYFFDPSANNTFYAGGGIGWGGISATKGDGEDDTGLLPDPYTGAGLHIKAVTGYSMLRASTIRFFFELGATVPFYDLERTFNDEEDSFYSPVYGLSVGVGWSKGPDKTLTIRKI